MYELRQYQKDLISKIYQSWESGNRRVMAQLPTGGGKTLIFSEISKKMLAEYKKVLVIAHRHELILQAAKKIEQVTGEKVGIIKSGQHYKPNLKVYVASVQSFWTKCIDIEPELLIIDEAHRSSAATYSDIIELYSDKRLLGMTATPCRMDGQGFNNLYDDLVIGADIKDLIDQGYLCDYTILASPITIPIEGIESLGGDYNVNQLEKAARKISGDIVPTWKKNAFDKKTIVFAISKAHSKQITKLFCEAGIKAEHVDGATSSSERDKIFTRFRNGETKVLCNVNLITEGFDCPDTECIVVLRPTMSLTMHLQMLGRGLRPHETKDKLLIIDHTDNWVRHGEPKEQRTWSLEPVAIGTHFGTHKCPSCNHVFKPLPRETKPYRQTIDEEGVLKDIHKCKCPTCGLHFEYVLGVTLKGQKQYDELLIPTGDKHREMVEIDLTITQEYKELIDSIFNSPVHNKKGYDKLKDYPEAVSNFTQADIRYLILRSGLSPQANILAIKNILQSQKTKTILNSNKPNPRLASLVLSLKETAKHNRYEYRWIYHQFCEHLNDKTKLLPYPTTNDWLFLAAEIGQTETWAFRKENEWKKMVSLKRTKPQTITTKSTSIFVSTDESDELNVDNFKKRSGYKLTTKG